MAFDNLKNIIKQRRWKKLNPNNKTIFLNYSYFDNVVVGDYSYGKINAIFTNKDYFLRIGRFCSIGPNVTFIVSSEHPTCLLLTYPINYLLHGDIGASSKGDIVVGDDVWIGANTTILSGVSIGNGSIIAAGSVVTKNIPPYTIVGGVPAKEIKKRFPKEIIEKMCLIDYSKIDKEIISRNIDIFEKEMTMENVERALSKWRKGDE